MFYVCEVDHLDSLKNLDIIEGFSGTVGGGHNPVNHHTVISTTKDGYVVGEFADLAKAQKRLYNLHLSAIADASNANCTLRYTSKKEVQHG